MMQISPASCQNFYPHGESIANSLSFTLSPRQAYDLPFTQNLYTDLFPASRRVPKATD